MAEHDNLNPMDTAPKDGTAILVKFENTGWIQCTFEHSGWVPIVLSCHSNGYCLGHLDENEDKPIAWTNLPYEAEGDIQC